MTPTIYKPMYRTQEEANEMEGIKYTQLVKMLTLDERVWQKISEDHEEIEFFVKGKDQKYFDRHARQFGTIGFNEVLKTITPSNHFNALYLSVQKVNRVYNFDEGKRVNATKDAWKNVPGNPFEEPKKGWRIDNKKDYDEERNAYPTFPYVNARLWLAQPDHTQYGGHCDWGSQYGIALIQAEKIPDAEMGKILQQYELTLLQKHQIRIDFTQPFERNSTLNFANELMLLYKVQGLKSEAK